jgi:hypothetical protein
MVGITRERQSPDWRLRHANRETGVPKGKSQRNSSPILIEWVSAGGAA